mmetsp:Transcript_12961/g.24244  ORF Transcript_12961/g.24244 Transcript_12961/m.24244 type:complete len:136 (+) Transcript_12961:290-697(+)
MIYPNGAYCPSKSFVRFGEISRIGSEKNSDDPPLDTRSGWFIATMLGMSKDSTGRKLDVAAAAVVDDDDDVDEEKERCGDDDDVSALYLVVPVALTSSSIEAKDEEYVSVALLGPDPPRATTSNGILRGLAVRGS